jgi:hypothetical protein
MACTLWQWEPYGIWESCPELAYVRYGIYSMQVCL